jgi:hypothetical protein
MKQIVFSLFCFFSISSFAQEPEWFELGTTWTYRFEMALDFFGEVHQTTLQVTEEVILNDQVCKKIERLEPENNALFGCSSLLPPFYVYESNDSIFFASDYDTTFRLAYDFGAEIGDTWIFDVPVEIFEGLTSYEVTVTDIQTEEIDGQALKVLTLDYEIISGEEYSYVGFNSLEITEYLGRVEKDFIFPFGDWNVCDGAFAQELMCFQSSSMNYLNPDYASCFLSTSQGSKKTGIAIFPNPSDDIISWDTPIDQLRIYDSHGKLTLQNSQVNNTSFLSVKTLDKGLYVIVLENEDGIFSQKLIIQ